jgi:hypothetical protein
MDVMSPSHSGKAINTAVKGQTRGSKCAPKTWFSHIEPMGTVYNPNGQARSKIHATRQRDKIEVEGANSRHRDLININVCSSSFLQTPWSPPGRGHHPGQRFSVPRAQ